MAPSFQFSHRPNRAPEIPWREWSAEAFAEATAASRPILLSLAAAWCEWCQRMDETTYSDPAVIAALRDHFIPIRVDTDRMPHVQDRYLAGGWPTTAFLTPRGAVLWADRFVEAPQLLSVADSVARAWRERHAELDVEVDRRERALEAARARQQVPGLVRRQAADDVLTCLCQSFDARNGGFGEAPKFPSPDAIELLYVQARHGDATLVDMADRTLDGMIAGELWDAAEGGFFRYATGDDWTGPRYEKLLAANAAQLASFALGASLRARADWCEVAEQTVAWVERTLRLPGGLWSAAQCADSTYFAAAASARATLPRPPVDPTIYTPANARWIAALAFAGGRLDRPDWIARAADALPVLVETMRGPGDLLNHFRPAGEGPQLATLLVDTLETARAALMVFQASGDAALLEQAGLLARALERHFWADDGGFWDRMRSTHDVGSLRFRERDFELNATAARLLLDLASATGERGWRAHAERTLALLAPQAGHWGVAGAGFALAVEEFFHPAPRIVLVGDPAAGAPLRSAALALLLPAHRVWTLPEGGRLNTITFRAEPAPAAYACTERGCSPPQTEPHAIAATLAPLL
ncbi:MAG TPA: DUF255 domain-containing protein [Longimicrobiales bacterium]|nr:DUF255 domain-containing protein [Longimicrobiales bacterium]